MKKLLLPLILILLLIFTLVGNCAWLDGWDQRIELTVDSSKIDTANLTWFPVTVHLTAAQAEEIFSELDADADYMKVAFTKDDGTTELYAECELFDQSESVGIYHVSKDGWVLTHDADTDFYMYYDNDASSNSTYISKSGGTAGQSVYDANFKAVYHMNDGGIATTAKFYQKGASDYADDGMFVVVDTGNSGVKYNFSYTADWQEITIDLTSPDDTFGGVMNWEAINYYFFRLETIYRTIYLDNIRVYDQNGVLIHSNMCESVTNWSVSLGLFWLEDTIIQEGSHSIKLYSGNSNADVIYDPGTPNWFQPIFDSTSNANHGTKKGAGEPVEASGKVGMAQDFDGTDDYIDITKKLCSSISKLTFESLVKVNSVLADSSVCLYRENDNGWNGTGPEFTISSNTLLPRFTMANGYPPAPPYVNSSDAISLSTWYLLTGTYDKDGDAKIYINDAVKGSEAQDGTTPASAYNGKIGWYDNTTGTEDWNDIEVCEFRLSYTNRSAAWVKATYNSLWDSLMTYGSEELLGIMWNGIIITKWNGIPITKINGK